jgi:PII-like signaling protein
MTTLHEALPGKKLKVFLVEEDKGRHEPLYMTILRLLHDAGVAGATVFRGNEGFGERRVIHTDKLEVMSFNLPITIEATDTPEKIDAVAPRVAELLTSGLVEVSRTSILRQGSAPPPNAPLQGGNVC